MEVNWSDCALVEAVAGKVGGKPVVRGTRVPADTIPEAAELGETPEEIAWNYDLKQDEVRRLLEYAGFEVLLSGDKSIRHKQSCEGPRFRG